MRAWGMQGARGHGPMGQVRDHGAMGQKGHRSSVRVGDGGGAPIRVPATCDLCLEGGGQVDVGRACSERDV